MSETRSFGTVTFAFEADTDDEIHGISEQLQQIIEEQAPEIHFKCNVTEDIWTDQATIEPFQPEKL